MFVESVREARAAIGWGVLAIGIVPAILEEFFFRGLLFRALKAHAGAAVTIGVSGVLFGVTHVFLGGTLGLERLVPTTILGLILGAVCWYTGSIWPSMILHVCHNAILIGVNPDVIPWQWLVAGISGTTLGVMLVWQGGRAEESVARGP